MTIFLKKSYCKTKKYCFLYRMKRLHILTCFGLLIDSVCQDFPTWHQHPASEKDNDFPRKQVIKRAQTLTYYLKIWSMLNMKFKLLINTEIVEIN